MWRHRKNRKFSATYMRCDTDSVCLVMPIAHCPIHIFHQVDFQCRTHSTFIGDKQTISLCAVRLPLAKEPKKKKKRLPMCAAVSGYKLYLIFFFFSYIIVYSFRSFFNLIFSIFWLSYIYKRHMWIPLLFGFVLCCVFVTHTHSEHRKQVRFVAIEILLNVQLFGDCECCCCCCCYCCCSFAFELHTLFISLLLWHNPEDYCAFSMFGSCDK